MVDATSEFPNSSIDQKKEEGTVRRPAQNHSD